MIYYCPMKKYIYFIIIGCLLIAGTAYGHEWFDPECCDGNDCIKISCSDVENQGSKYYYQGIEAKKVLPSQDENCYVCPRYSNGIIDLIRCLYIKQHLT